MVGLRKPKRVATSKTAHVALIEGAVRVVQPQIAHVRDRGEAAKVRKAFSRVLRLTPQWSATAPPRPSRRDAPG